MNVLEKSQTNARPKVVRLKRIFGILYGVISGLSFAAASWGWNGSALNNAHGYYPWTAFVVGGAACILIGGLAGWLTAVSENSLAGTLIWLVSSAFFAWLIVALPLQIAPLVVSQLDPQFGAFIAYDPQSAQFPSRFWVALMWIFLFTLVVGAAQISICESAVFSVSGFGKIIPFSFCVLIMGISGAATDSLINVYFREAVESLDRTIQFVVDNQHNEQVDLSQARRLHAMAFSPVSDLVSPARFLHVGRYDSSLEDLHVFVKFESGWVDCHVLYNQPILCKAVLPPP